MGSEMRSEEVMCDLMLAKRYPHVTGAQGKRRASYYSTPFFMMFQVWNSSIVQQRLGFTRACDTRHIY